MGERPARVGLSLATAGTAYLQMCFFGARAEGAGVKRGEKAADGEQRDGRVGDATMTDVRGSGSGAAAGDAESLELYLGKRACFLLLHNAAAGDAAAAPLKVPLEPVLRTVPQQSRRDAVSATTSCSCDIGSFSRTRSRGWLLSLSRMRVNDPINDASAVPINDNVLLIIAGSFTADCRVSITGDQNRHSPTIPADSSNKVRFVEPAMPDAMPTTEILELKHPVLL